MPNLDHAMAAGVNSPNRIETNIDEPIAVGHRADKRDIPAGAWCSAAELLQLLGQRHLDPDRRSFGCDDPAGAS